MSGEKQATIRDLVVLAALGVVVLFTNLGGPRLWDRDEPRNAGCAYEMRERGDWITPWFNDELRSHKPVLLYWLILTAYSVFGVNEFAARFWSATLGIGTVWLTYGIGRRLFNARVGFWAGLVLMSTLMFDVASRAATPDAALLFCVTLALAAYVWGEFPRREGGVGRDWTISVRGVTALACYSAMGLAVLAKGPVGAVLPTAVIGMFLLVRRLPAATPVMAGDSTAIPTTAAAPPRFMKRLWRGLVACVRPFAPLHFLETCWAMRPATAVALILAIAAPWYVWVGVKTDGEFLRGFFWQHNVARAVQSFEGHRGGPWFYPLALCIGFFPWSVFATPLGFDLVRRWRRDLADRPSLVFLFCWAGVWIGLFSLAKTKLPSYITPSYPALALLVATFLVRWREGAALVGKQLERLPLAVLGLAGLGAAIGLPIAAYRYLPGAEWVGVIGLVPMVGAAVAWRLTQQDRRALGLATVAAAALLFVTGLFSVVAQVVDTRQQSHVLLAAIDQYDAQSEVGSLGGYEPSWVFYGRRPIQELTLEPSYAQASQAAATSPYAAKPIAEVEAFLTENRHRIAIVHGRQLAALQTRFGGRLVVLAEAPKFLRNETLHVVTLHEEVARRP
ncbi:MAG: glycosyltransferase family 39 protein [Pirellulales bacterium]